MSRSSAPRAGGPTGLAGIDDEILALNLRRIYRLTLILVPIHIAHVLIFWRHDSLLDPAAASWRQGIMTAHAIMIPVAIGLALLSRAATNQRLAARIRRILPTVASLSYLAFGAAIAVVDQLVTSSITPLLLTTLGVASAILIPPRTAAVTFAISMAAFWILISVTQTDPQVLLSQRVNSISMAGTGFGIAYLLWQSQIRTLEQRREIEAQKQELERKNEELALMVNRDPLTGVANRSHLTSVAAVEAARMKRNASPASLVLLDLDRFKAVNDSYGHPIGDAVLRQVAQVLAAEVRAVDTLARLGGEEFAILLPDTPLAEAAKFAERIRAAIEKHTFNVGGIELDLTASIGAASIDPHAPDPFAAAYRDADRMLYHAKENGRNRVCCALEHADLTE